MHALNSPVCVGRACFQQQTHTQEASASVTYSGSQAIISGFEVPHLEGQEALRIQE